MKKNEIVSAANDLMAALGIEGEDGGKAIDTGGKPQAITDGIKEVMRDFILPEDEQELQPETIEVLLAIAPDFSFNAENAENIDPANDEEKSEFDDQDKPDEREPEADDPEDEFWTWKDVNDLSIPDLKRLIKEEKLKTKFDPDLLECKRNVALELGVTPPMTTRKIQDSEEIAASTRAMMLVVDNPEITDEQLLKTMRTYGEVTIKQSSLRSWVYFTKKVLKYIDASKNTPYQRIKKKE